LGTVMTMSWGDHDRERAAAAITREMELGSQPSTAASESFVCQVGDPLFRRPNCADDGRHWHGDERAQVRTSRA
jgi:hypothetical protein